MYSRKLGDRTLTFGHEGLLYKNSFVMYDSETKSLWVHTTGESVRGPLAGRRLDFLPSLVVPWSVWKEKYPATTVLLGRPARGFMGTFALVKSPQLFGISVGQGSAPTLYPVSFLAKSRVVNDDESGQALVVVMDPSTLAARAYERAGLTFEWERGQLRDDKGERWDPLTGRSQDGRETLAPVPATAWLTERWKAFYPKGRVQGP